jgi:hypothetical protein
MSDMTIVNAKIFRLISMTGLECIDIPILSVYNLKLNIVLRNQKNVVRVYNQLIDAGTFCFTQCAIYRPIYELFTGKHYK